MTDYATWLDETDINHSEDIIYATPAVGIGPGDRLVLYDLHGGRGKFWLDVLSVEETGWEKHRYAIAVKGDRMDELREALTYEVADG
jgi:hypothetical protein